MREEQGRPIYHCVSMPVFYRAVHPLRDGLDSANNYYSEKCIWFRNSCRFYRLLVQVTQHTLRHKVFQRK